MSINYDELDPGIRDTVRWLRAHGHETTDSGDGVTKADLIAEGEALDVPHVFMQTVPEEMTRLADALRTQLNGIGLAGKGHIEASYSPDDGVAIIALFDVNDEVLVSGEVSE